MSYTTVNSQEISIDCISVLSWKVHAYNTVTIIINDNANRGKWWIRVHAVTEQSGAGVVTSKFHEQ